VLLPHKACVGKLSNNVPVTGSDWVDDVVKALDRVAS
jgi:hypothetical protein